MLSNNSINNAAGLTAVLTNADIVLSPVGNTPLEALVKATRAQDTFVEQAEDNTTRIDTETILYMANKADETLNVCQHDTAMDEICEVAINAVKNHIAFARGTVKPAIEALVNSTQDALGKVITDTILNINVEHRVTPELFSNSTFKEFVEPFVERFRGDISRSINLQQLTVAEIKELLMTGNNAIDSSVNEWAAIKGDLFLLNAWEILYTYSDSLAPADTTLSDILYKDEFGTDYAVFAFLISNRLYNDPLPETPMTLDAFNKEIITYRNLAAAVVIDAFANLVSINETGRLVESISTKNIVVNDHIFTDWMNNGGDVEVLYGLAISDKTIRHVDAINAVADELKQAWTQHAALALTVENNLRFTRTKEFLDMFFRNSLEEKMANNTPGYSAGECQQYIELFKNELSALNTDDVVALYPAALKLLCRSEFYRTDAERILTGIEETKRALPDMDVREAATISVINYVAYWVASQIKFDKVY